MGRERGNDEDDGGAAVARERVSDLSVLNPATLPNDGHRYRDSPRPSLFAIHSSNSPTINREYSVVKCIGQWGVLYKVESEQEKDRWMPWRSCQRLGCHLDEILCTLQRS